MSKMHNRHFYSSFTSSKDPENMLGNTMVWQWKFDPLKLALLFYTS